MVNYLHDPVWKQVYHKGLSSSHFYFSSIWIIFQTVFQQTLGSLLVIFPLFGMNLNLPIIIFLMLRSGEGIRLAHLYLPPTRQFLKNRSPATLTWLTQNINFYAKSFLYLCEEQFFKRKNI